MTSPRYVHKLFARFTKPQKDKYHVVAYLDNNIRFFLINSNVAPFLASNQVMMNHQVSLSPDNETFLDYDSYLNCAELVGGYDLAELVRLNACCRPIFQGEISSVARNQVKEVVQNSILLNKKEKAAILSGW